MKSKIRVAIVGGGIGGVTTAIALQKKPNLDVKIYEAAPEFAEIGAGMGFTPNAARSLEQISPEAFELYQSICTRPLDERRKNVWVTYRRGTDASNSDFWAAPTDMGAQTFYRPRLLNGLVKFLADGTAFFKKKFVSVTEGPSGLTIHFADGTTAEADCMLGADGVHSTIRRHVVGADWAQYEPMFHGICAYRNVIPMDEARAVVGEELVLSPFIHSSRDHMAVSYPIDGGKLFNLAAFDLRVTKDPGPWHTEADLDHLERYYSQWAPQAQKLVGLLRRPGTMKWPVRELPDLPTFVSGKVAILGDAAHAMTPFQGAGAGQAIEDAYVLQGVLGLVENRSQVSLALRAYDEIRRPRVQLVAQGSREAGELQSMRFPGVAEDDDASMIKELSVRFSVLWDYQVQNATESACERYRQLVGDVAPAEKLASILASRVSLEPQTV